MLNKYFTSILCHFIFNFHYYIACNKFFSLLNNNLTSDFILIAMTWENKFSRETRLNLIFFARRMVNFCKTEVYKTIIQSVSEVTFSFHSFQSIRSSSKLRDLFPDLPIYFPEISPRFIITASVSLSPPLGYSFPYISFVPRSEESLLFPSCCRSRITLSSWLNFLSARGQTRANTSKHASRAIFIRA